MKLCYIVTSGSYEDYKIEAVFADKKKAILYANQDKDYEVGHYLIDAEAEDMYTCYVIANFTKRKSVKSDIWAHVYKATHSKPIPCGTRMHFAVNEDGAYIEYYGNNPQECVDAAFAKIKELCPNEDIDFSTAKIHGLKENT